jgi:hypothetical protein
MCVINAAFVILMSIESLAGVFIITYLLILLFRNRPTIRRPITSRVAQWTIIRQVHVTHAHGMCIGELFIIINITMYHYYHAGCHVANRINDCHANIGDKYRCAGVFIIKQT